MNNIKLHGLEVTTTVGCKLDCTYCPQQKLISEYRKKCKPIWNLSLENFKQCLSKVEKGATINFFGMSEPFHNSECADMILYAYQEGYKIGLNTTLVGMTKEDFEKIKNVKFDHFILHIPDEEKNAKFIITDEYLEILKSIEDSIYINYYSCHGTVHPKVKDYIQKNKFAGINVSDRAGNLDDKTLQKVSKKGRIVCGSGSEENIGVWAPVLFPDGSLALCCNDYGLDHIVGNLIEENWNDILQGEEMRRVKNGQKNDAVPVLCRKCICAIPVENMPSYNLNEKIKHWKLSRDLDLNQDDLIIMEKICNAKTICVYGLGKLFKEHFFPGLWNECLSVDILADGNEAVWGERFNDIPCINPHDLQEYEDLLIIIHALNCEGIKDKLNTMGLTNYISIFDIYRLAGQKIKIVNGNVLFLR